MSNRIVLGKANDGSSDIYGLWVSKPAISGGFNGNVINGSGVLCDQEDMLFDSRKGKFNQVLAKNTGTGSGQTVTVPAGKRVMLLMNGADSRNLPSLTSQGTPAEGISQTLSGTTMTLIAKSGVKYLVLLIEAGDA